jgi:23S rRNA pseudouridine2605 synthase
VKINGKVVRDLSTQILSGDKVELNGKEIRPDQGKVYIIMNKPKGYVTSCYDEKGRKTVLELIDTTHRVFPVGRLDYDTEGLLILTNDGDFAQKIIHPRNKVSKVYIATVNEPVTEQHIQELGIAGADQVERVGECTIKIVIHTGLNRQIRKMIASVGLETLALKRTAIGKLQLGNLKRGETICKNSPPVI